MRRLEREVMGPSKEERLHQQIADEYSALLRAAMGDTHRNGNDTAKTIDERAKRYAREVGPITVATFPC